MKQDVGVMDFYFKIEFKFHYVQMKLGRLPIYIGAHT